MFSAMRDWRSAASPLLLPAKADTQANHVTQPDPMGGFRQFKGLCRPWNRQRHTLHPGDEPP